MNRLKDNQDPKAPSQCSSSEELIRVSRFYRELAAETVPSRTEGSSVSSDLERLEKILAEQPSSPAAEDASRQIRRCLALLDSSITPFLLRIHIERHTPVALETVSALFRYFLTKPPAEDADRDKLDYLATLLFSSETDHPLPMRADAPEDEVWLSLFAGLHWDKLAPEQEELLDQMAGLIPRLQLYSDFEDLVNSKVVYQARNMKKSLSPALPHPEVVTHMVQFNLAFRRRFEELFREETERVRAVTRQQIRDAADLKAYFAAEAGVAAPESPSAPAALVGSLEKEMAGELKERPELEKYQRRFTRPLEELQLKTLTSRLRESFSRTRVPPEAVVFVPLTHASFAVSPWEVEAFMPQPAAGEPSRALHAVTQRAVVLRARLEEELTLYREKRETRYLWKPHLDSLAYAVGSASDLLAEMREALADSAAKGVSQQRSQVARSALDLIHTLEEVDRCLGRPSS